MKKEEKEVIEYLYIIDFVSGDIYEVECINSYDKVIDEILEDLGLNPDHCFAQFLPKSTIIKQKIKYEIN